MPIILWLHFILHLSIISMAPVYAGQNIALATTKASDKAATVELLEVSEKENNL